MTMTPMTTKESEVDVLHAIEQANVALGVAGLPPDDIFRAELRQARAAVAEVFEEAKNALDGLELSGLSFAATRLRAALRNAGVKV